MNREKRSGVTALYVVRIKPDKVEAAIAEVMRMLPVARSQPANINLDLHQDPADPTRLMFYENWASEEELGRWVATPEMKAYFARLSPMFAGEPDITRWRMISDAAAANE